MCEILRVRVASSSRSVGTATRCEYSENLSTINTQHEHNNNRNKQLFTCDSDGVGAKLRPFGPVACCPDAIAENGARPVNDRGQMQSKETNIQLKRSCAQARRTAEHRTQHSEIRADMAMHTCLWTLSGAVCGLLRRPAQTTNESMP